ncbi:GDSL esterase/lipase At1g54790, partial [Linum perenne]
NVTRSPPLSQTGYLCFNSKPFFPNIIYTTNTPIADRRSLTLSKSSKAHMANYHDAMIITCFLLLLIMIPCSRGYPAVFNFGDSNSDTGGLVAGVAFPVGPPNGETYFHKPSGRFSDGRLIIDFLMHAVDLPFLNPYLESVGAPNFTTGTNFATGGATILPANAASRNPFSFGIQVAQYSRFKARVLELLATGKKELQKYLPEEDYFHSGLFMFDVGQNDLYVAFFSKTEEQVIASIPGILSEFEIGIQKLYNLGARNFWIHNTGPLGCLARVISAATTAAAAAAGNKPKSSDDLDQFGCLASRNRASTAFNSHLNHLCTNLKSQFPDINLTYVDVYSVKLDLIANYTRYGFKEPLAACCGYGGPPLNFDSRVDCGVTKNINGSTATAKPCDDASGYVNWDGIHYTEAANQFVAQRLMAGGFESRLMVF